jgi:putative transposase
MPYPQPTGITLSKRQQNLLEQIVSRPNSPQGLVKRVQLVLSAARGINNTKIAQQLQMNRGTVRKWRGRWSIAASKLSAAEVSGISDKQLTQMMITILKDFERPGTPATFTTEQVVQIVALACEDPERSQRPVSHWTPPELALEAIKRGLVEKISRRSVGRFLKGGYPTTPS